MENTNSVDVKGNLDLGNTSWCRWNSCNVELAKEMVVLGHGSLTLIDLDSDSRLAIGVIGEGLLGRDGGVPRDQSGHDSSGSLDIKV